MKIETKFNPGNEAYFLSGTKLVKNKIDSVKTDTGSDLKTEINYFFFDENRNCTMKNEGELFATKADFLDQLETGNE